MYQMYGTKSNKSNVLEGIDASTIQTLTSLDPDQLIKLAEIARSLQGGAGAGKQSTAAQSNSTPSQANRSKVAVCGEERYYGFVKSYNHGKGFGFISCDHLQQEYGQDVFLHKNEYAAATAYEGAQVSFGIQINKAGQPQATNVLLNDGEAAGVKRKRPENERGVEEYVIAAKKARKGSRESLSEVYEVFGGSGSYSQQGSKSVYTEKRPPVNIEGGPYIGTVKSYNEAKGFGFLTCDETFAIYQRDIFLHRNEADGIPNLKIGDQVQFTLQLNALGNPQAVGTSAV